MGAIQAIFLTVICVYVGVSVSVGSFVASVIFRCFYGCFANGGMKVIRELVDYSIIE